MNKKTKIKILVKVADELDRLGMSEEADFIDSIIGDTVNQPEELEIDIPEEEYDMLQQVYEALGQSLK